MNNHAAAAVLCALGLCGAIAYGVNEVEQNRHSAMNQSSRQGATDDKLNSALGAGEASKAGVMNNPFGQK